MGNQLADNLWTYSIDAIWFGVQDCYRDLRANVVEEYGVEIETLSAIGVSAMMHDICRLTKRQNSCAVPHLEKYQYRSCRSRIV